MALGEKTPPLSVMLRIVGFLVRTMPLVAGKARRPKFDGLNRISLRCRKPVQPRPPAQGEAAVAGSEGVPVEARDIAAPMEVEVLIDQIDAALAELPRH